MLSLPLASALFLLPSSFCHSRYMAANALALIRQVDNTRTNYRLKVRIIHLWRMPDFYNPTHTYRLGLIFMDEEGERIEALVQRRNLVQFDRLLSERTAYYVDKPRVEDNNSKYKYSDGPFKLLIGAETRFRRCADFTGTLHGFNFVDFSPLPASPEPTERVVDMLARVEEIHELETIPVKGNKTSPRIKVDIQDLEHRQIRLTLWGDFADSCSPSFLPPVLRELSSLYCNLQNCSTIEFFDMGIYAALINMGAFFIISENQPCFSNLPGISKLLINGDLPEFTGFAKRLQPADVPVDNTTPPRRLTPIILSVRTDFLGRNFPMCMSAVSSIDKITKAVVVGTIAYIAGDLPWYYPGCTACNCKVVNAYDDIGDASAIAPDEEEKTVLRCTNQGCTAKEVDQVPRFKLQMRVEDATGFTYLTMFDGDVARAVLTTAHEMSRRYEKVTGDANLPPEFKSLLGKKYAFLIDVISYNLQKKNYVYRIAKFTPDGSIISELENRLGLLQDVGSTHESAATPVSAIEGIITPTPPTPMSKDKGHAVDLQRHNLKRNLLSAFNSTDPASTDVHLNDVELVSKRTKTVAERKGTRPT